MNTFAISIDFRKFTCGLCAGVYALAENYAKKKQEEGGFWTCPYCAKPWGYHKDGSELEQAKRLIAAAQDRASANWQRYLEETERKAAVERRLSAEKAVVTRMRRRAAAGVCQCCKRTFQDLARHMQSKHPAYAAEEKA